MPKDAPLDFKYKTKAGVFYRELLKAQAEGKDAPSAPNEVEGLELVGNMAPPTNIQPGSLQGFGSTPMPDNSGFTFEKVKTATYGAMSDAAKATKNAVDKVGQKVKDPEFHQQVKDVGSKIVSETKNVAGIAVEQGKILAKELPGVAGKGYSALKTGWGSALNFIKEKTGTGQPTQPQNQGIVVDHGTHQELFVPSNGNKAEEVTIKDEGNIDIKTAPKANPGGKPGDGNAYWNNDY